MRIFTKFFDEDTLEHIQAGSIKFGSLVGYNGEENIETGEKVRMTDHTESGLEQHLYADPTEPFNFKGGGLELVNSQLFLSGGGPMLSGQLTMNKYVFCASEGPYDPIHHHQMLYGSPIPSRHPYRGNSDLTHYAEFDLHAFVEAVEEQLRSRSNLFPDGYTGYTFEKVEYREKKVFPLQEKNFDGQEMIMSHEEFFETAFVKPQSFTTEREVRMVLHGNNDTYLAYDPNALFLQSENIRRSIRSVGKY